MEEPGLAYLIAKLADKNEPVFIHGKRVAKLACVIAETLGYSDEEIKTVHRSAVVHDIGKLRLPAEILNKKEALNKDEVAIIQKHPQLGHYLLKEILRSESIIAEVVLQHHERLDGSGYPLGLRDGVIHPIARIISVADVIEALTSPQAYRPAWTMDEALDKINKSSGVLYDPDVVIAAMVVIQKKEFVF